MVAGGGACSGGHDGAIGLLWHRSDLNCDLNYAILLIAAVKASLFEAQSCRTMIVPEPQPPYVAPLLAAHPTRVLQFPNLDGILDGRALNYPYKKTFKEAACQDHLVSIHTLGSTGKCDNQTPLGPADLVTRDSQS